MNDKSLKFAVVMLLVLGVALSATVQSSATPAQQSAPPAKALMLRRGPGAGMPGGMFAYGRIMGGFGGPVVKNAPFSALVTRESIQVLADGNRIDRKVTGTLARDAMGRTRREMSFPAIGPLAATGPVPRFVFIKDPVSGKNYILNERKKTALEMNMSFGKKFRALKFAHSRMGGKAPEVSTESLGTKTVDGVAAQGTRTTRTIAAGQIGNEKPIVITTEKWYAPDLQTILSLTRTDPRFGTSTYQLTNINRADPPQSLFMVPQDYTIRPIRAFKRHLARRGPPSGGF